MLASKSAKPRASCRVGACGPAVLLVLALGLDAPAHAADIAEPIEFEPPRSVGYLLGDFVEHRLGVFVHSPWQLDTDALPEAGQATRWLERLPPRVDSSWRPGGRQYHVTVRYQIIDALPRVLGIGTPPVVLTVRNGEQTLPLLHPAWGFNVSPMVAVDEERVPGALPELQPIRLPPPIDQRGQQAGLALLASTALVLFAWLANRYGWLPRLGRPPGPFARALKAFGKAPPSARLATVHGAFNDTFGGALFTPDLDTFFTVHPDFVSQRARIEAFFRASEQHLFRDAASNPAALGERELLGLLRAGRAAERRASATAKDRPAA